MLSQARGSEPCTVTVFRTIAEDRLLRRVRSEFNEMRGMRLTLNQAMRLWSLDRAACAELLSSLVEAQFLVQDEHGRYHRAHGAAPLTTPVETLSARQRSDATAPTRNPTTLARRSS